MTEDRIKKFLLGDLEEGFRKIRYAKNNIERTRASVNLYCRAERIREIYLSFLDGLEAIMSPEEDTLLRESYADASFNMCEWAKYNSGSNTPECYRVGEEILRQIRENLPIIIQGLKNNADSKGLEFNYFTETLREDGIDE